jgi:type II secretory pathway component PulJ
MKNCSKGLAARRRPGFTLLEVIIAMGMAMIVLAGVVMLYSTANRSYVKQDNMVALEQNIRSTMEIMGHELRMAGYIPLNSLSTGSSPITTDVAGQGWANGKIEQIEEAGAQWITFVADMNADNIPETIRYWLNGTTLTRQSWSWNGGAWQPETTLGAMMLVQNVTNFQLVYTFENRSTGVPNNADGTNVNDRKNVRGIAINITAQTPTRLATVGGGGGGVQPTATMHTFIRMRNMGLETGNL